MFDDWFKSKLNEILAAADPVIAKDLERAAQVGKTLVDYLMLQLNGISITTQPVKKAEPVSNPPEGFRG